MVQRALQKPAQEQFGLEIGNEARLVLQASLPVDSRAAQLYSEGLEALRAWDAPTARDRFERAIKIEPRNAWSWYYLADVHWRQGEYDRCTAMLDRSESYRRDDVELQRLSLELRERCR